eukprot:7011527-Prymnesium_polylepis.1
MRWLWMRTAQPTVSATSSPSRVGGSRTYHRPRRSPAASRPWSPSLPIAPLAQSSILPRRR